MTLTSKDVRGRMLAAHGHLVEVLKRRGKWEAYLQDDPFPLSVKPFRTRTELVIWLRSRNGKRAIEVESRAIEVPLPIAGA